MFQPLVLINVVNLFGCYINKCSQTITITTIIIINNNNEAAEKVEQSYDSTVIQ